MVNKSVEILQIDRTDDPYTQKTKKANPYICDIRARIDCEPLSEHSTHSETFTNMRIGFFGFLSVYSLSIAYLEEVESPFSLSCHFFRSTKRPNTNATIPTPIPV